MNWLNTQIEKYTMRNIIEIQLSNKGISKKKQWDIILALHKNVLHKDKHWHFFYEVFFNIVRVSKKYVPEVIKILGDIDAKYEIVGPWIDNQPITKKHQKNFRSIFHEFSEIIVKTNDITEQDKLFTEVWLLADRMCHCFINNCYYIAEPWKKESRRASSWENYLMNSLSSGRTSYNASFVKSCETMDMGEYDVDGFDYKKVVKEPVASLISKTGEKTEIKFVPPKATKTTKRVKV